jgi:hypothetical protein
LREFYRLKNGGEGKLNEILHILKTGAEPAPSPKQGDLAPAFLGLLPTRGCNLSCRYCGFMTSDESNKVLFFESLGRGCSEKLFRHWRESVLVEDDTQAEGIATTSKLRLTANGSWFTATMMAQLSAHR